MKQGRRADLDEVVITAGDNDVGAVLAKAHRVYIILMGLDSHVGLHRRSQQ